MTNYYYNLTIINTNTSSECIKSITLRALRHCLQYETYGAPENSLTYELALLLSLEMDFTVWSEGHDLYHIQFLFIEGK